MIEQIALLMRPILNFPLIRRTRRNHALEHATIHILTSRYRRGMLSGRSTDGGFVLVGDVPTHEVEAATQEALRRMKNGEHHLAIHPNCGTNLVTTSAMATATGFIGLRAGTGDRPMSGDRLAWTMIMMMFAVLFSRPVGMRVQRYITTDGDPGDLEFVSATRREVKWFGSSLVMHNVITRRG